MESSIAVFDDGEITVERVVLPERSPCEIDVAIGATADGPPAAPARALVFGAGAVGAFCAAMLASLGWSVFVSEPSAERRALAERLGARPVEPDAETFPLVVEASGSAEAVSEAIERADIGGRVIAAGSVRPGSTLATLDPAIVVTRRLSLQGVHNYTSEDFRWGLDWLRTHGPDLILDELVSPPVALSDVSHAFQDIQNGHHLLVLVQPEAT